MPRPQVPEEILIQMQALWEAGVLSKVEIAKKYNKHPETLRLIAKKYGWGEPLHSPKNIVRQDGRSIIDEIIHNIQEEKIEDASDNNQESCIPEHETSHEEAEKEREMRIADTKKYICEQFQEEIKRNMQLREENHKTVMKLHKYMQTILDKGFVSDASEERLIMDSNGKPIKKITKQYAIRFEPETLVRLMEIAGMSQEKKADIFLQQNNLSVDNNETKVVSSDIDDPVLQALEEDGNIINNLYEDPGKKV